MKAELEKFIEEIVSQTGLKINANISSRDNNRAFISITVGHFGFMLMGTWQPQSNTRDQFNIDSNGIVYHYETHFDNNHKPFHKKIEKGPFKKVLVNEIKNLAEGCLDWAYESEKLEYKSAIEKLSSYGTTL